MFLNLPINPKAPAPLKGFSYNFIRPYLTSLSFYWYLAPHADSTSNFNLIFDRQVFPSQICRSFRHQISYCSLLRVSTVFASVSPDISFSVFDESLASSRWTSLSFTSWVVRLCPRGGGQYRQEDKKLGGEMVSRWRRSETAHE